MKKLAIPALLLVGALALAGCTAGSGGAPEAAGSAPASAEATQEAEQVPGKGNISSSGVDFTTLTDADMWPGTDSTFEFITSADAKGTLAFVPNTDPRVADVEKYLNEVVGYHREYMVAEVDNRNGSENANMYQVDVFDPEGTNYTFTRARDLVGDSKPIWDTGDTYTSADGQKTLTEAEYRKLTDRGGEVIKSLADNASPLGKETFIMVMPIDEGELPEKITGITVMAHGIMDEVPAYNPLISEYKEWKAAQEMGKEWTAYDPDAEPTEGQ